MSREECEEHLRLADEKLEAARYLLREGFPRDAAGRAYYAMFHAATALVRTKGHAPKTHRGLLGLLGQEFVRPGILSREDAAAFTKAQALREWGDYEIGVAPTEEARRKRLPTRSVSSRACGGSWGEARVNCAGAGCYATFDPRPDGRRDTAAALAKCG